MSKIKVREHRANGKRNITDNKVAETKERKQKNDNFGKMINEFEKAAKILPKASKSAERRTCIDLDRQSGQKQKRIFAKLAVK